MDKCTVGKEPFEYRETSQLPLPYSAAHTTRGFRHLVITNGQERFPLSLSLLVPSPLRTTSTLTQPLILLLLILSALIISVLRVCTLSRRLRGQAKKNAC